TVRTLPSPRATRMPLRCGVCRRLGSQSLPGATWNGTGRVSWLVRSICRPITRPWGSVCKGTAGTNIEEGGPPTSPGYAKAGMQMTYQPAAQLFGTVSGLASHFWERSPNVIVLLTPSAKDQGRVALL